MNVRRVRLNAWLHDPRGDSLPKHEAITYRKAFWSVTAIVTHAGIYANDAGGRRACLNDLHALMAEGKVQRWGNDSNTQWTVPLGAAA